MQCDAKIIVPHFDLSRGRTVKNAILNYLLMPGIGLMLLYAPERPAQPLSVDWRPMFGLGGRVPSCAHGNRRDSLQEEKGSASGFCWTMRTLFDHQAWQIILVITVCCAMGTNLSSHKGCKTLRQ